MKSNRVKNETMRFVKHIDCMQLYMCFMGILFFVLASYATFVPGLCCSLVFCGFVFFVPTFVELKDYIKKNY